MGAQPNAGTRIRTWNLRFRRPQSTDDEGAEIDASDTGSAVVGDDAQVTVAHSVAQAPADPRLEHINAVWDDLPDAVQQAMSELSLLSPGSPDPVDCA